jgi:DNA (cytosine-5)-methyltransferase 1
MGFPEWYDFSAVSRTDAAKQLANAVCPPVIASICKDIKCAISGGNNVQVLQIKVNTCIVNIL